MGKAKEVFLDLQLVGTEISQISFKISSIVHFSLTGLERHEGE